MDVTELSSSEAVVSAAEAVAAAPVSASSNAVGADDASSTVSNASLIPAAVVKQLRGDVAAALADREVEELMQTVAESNGLTLGELSHAPHTLTTLELFLLAIPRLPQLQFFPCLKVVRLMHIGLESMEDVQSLTMCEELWLSDNKIQRIEGLEKLVRLRRLYLHNNEISSMEGLPALRHLRELWLCNNLITSITGLDRLCRLRSVVLAGNPIDQLHGAFVSLLTHLREVNLAGCRLYSFDDLTALTVLPHLRGLWLSDALYGDNPLTRLNNYTTATLHLLPQLTMLDNNHVTQEQITLAESIYEKKRVYYSMRLHTLEQHHWRLRRQGELAAQGKLRQARHAECALRDCLAPVQAYFTEKKFYGTTSQPLVDNNSNSGGGSGDAAVTAEASLTELQNELQRAISTREIEAQRTVQRQAEALDAAGTLLERLKERLCLELHTGGNVRLEEAMPKDMWYESAKEYLLGRFREEAFKTRFGIVGVQVSRVFRVVNRGLRLHFDERVKELHIDLNDPAVRKHLVCLFSAVPPGREAQETLLQHVLVHGLDLPRRALRESAATTELLQGFVPPSSEGVPLTNSLFLADATRLQRCQRQGELSGINANPNALTGQVIVSRVFLGKAVMALGGKASSGTSGATLEEEVTALFGGRRVLRRDYAEDIFSVYRTHPTSSNSTSGGGADHARVWYCFDRALVLPEFVIDYTYVLAAPMLQAPSMTLFHDPEEFLRLVQQHRWLPAALSAADWGDVRSCGYPLVAFLQWCEDSPFDQFARSETDKMLSKSHSLLTRLCLMSSAEADKAAAEHVRESTAATSSPVARRHRVSSNASAATTPKDKLAATTTATQTLAGAHHNSSTHHNNNNSHHHHPPPPLSQPSSPPMPRQAASLTTSRVLSDAVPLTGEVVAAYQRAVRCESPDKLVYCQLRRRRLMCVPDNFETNAFGGLTTLDLSGNELDSVAWLALAKTAPSLQTLNLACNRLTRLQLQSVRILSLQTLDLRRNALDAVDDFAPVTRCFPQLQSLLVELNPCMQAKNAELILLSYLMHSRVTNLNGIRLEAHSKLSLAKVRRRRTLGFAGTGGLTDGAAASASLQSLVEASYGSWQPMHDIDLLSVDGSPVPARFFEAAVQSFLGDTVTRTAAASVGGMGRGRGVTSVSPYHSPPPPPPVITTNNGGTTVSTSAATVPSLSEVVCMQYNNSLMSDLHWLALLPRLQYLVLRQHNIADLSPVVQLRNLQLLDVQDNCLTSLPDLSALTQLHTLDVSFNLLHSLTGLGDALPELRCLCASGNELTSLSGAPLAQCAKLEELYLAHNALSSLQEFYCLRGLNALVTLDLGDNPLTTSASNASEARPYLIFHLRSLKVLDGLPISAEESQKARSVFTGRMNSDLLEERAGVPPAAWGTLSQLNLSHCALRELSLLDGFSALELLRLSHNQLTRVDGVAVLTRLKALDLAYNKLGSLAHGLGDALQPLVQLESLSLEGNHIVDVNQLALRLPQLKFLNLKSNELQYLDRGLEQLPELRELIVSQNKLRRLHAKCFLSCPLLAILTADENCLRSIDGVSSLGQLHTLSLGANRLADLTNLLAELKLCPLVRATFVGNPVARKANYRLNVIASFAHLAQLDGRAVLSEEREKAEALRVTEYVAPPNVFMDMSYAPEAFASPPAGVSLNGAIAANGTSRPPVAHRGLPPSTTSITAQPGLQGVFLHTGMNAGGSIAIPARGTTTTTTTPAAATAAVGAMGLALGLPSAQGRLQPMNSAAPRVSKIGATNGGLVRGGNGAHGGVLRNVARF